MKSWRLNRSGKIKYKILKIQAFPQANQFGFKKKSNIKFSKFRHFHKQTSLVLKKNQI